MGSQASHSLILLVHFLWLPRFNNVRQSHAANRVFTWQSGFSCRSLRRLPFGPLQLSGLSGRLTQRFRPVSESFVVGVRCGVGGEGFNGRSCNVPNVIIGEVSRKRHYGKT